MSVLGNFCPTRRHVRGDELVRLALPLDGDFAPAGVALRWTGESLEGEVFGSDRVDAAEKQVNKKTGDKYTDKVDDAQGRAEGAMGMDRDRDRP